jgi:RimJ/RimL family protein N-acetyltransferase
MEPWTRCETLPQTRRLSFRQWRASDVELAMGLWGDPRVTELIDARSPLSPEQVQGILAGHIALDEQHGVQYWPIFLRDAGEHVGCCGLRPYQLERRVLELGFQIRRARWGQGLATEAALAVIEHAFARLRAAALFAGHNPRNTASRHLLTKLGFRYTHDEHYAPTGLMHPSYLLEAGDHRPG